MRSRRRIAQRCRDIEPARGFAAVVMEMDAPLLGERSQILAESCSHS
jgi:hypothetical protein